MLVTLTVRDVMTETVLTTTPEATAREVATELRDRDIGSLVVIADGEPVGIVTESDIVGLASEGRDLDSVQVETFASGDLLVVGPDESIERAAELLGDHDFRRLPVVADGDLVGILTATDLSNYLPYLLRDQRAWTERRRARRERGSTAYEDESWEVELQGDDGTVEVGDRIRFTKELSAADVEAFAEASGDTNRLHLDEAFAARSRFGGRIAHGVLTAGVISAALARLPGLTIYLSQELSFLGPVRLGERVTAECEVVTDLGQGRYRIGTTAYTDDEAVLDGEAVVMIESLPEEADRAAEAAASDA